MSDLKQRAESVIPGGVNSPVRAFKSVDGDPIYVTRAEGPYLHTTDGKQLIDFCMSFGPLILGHAHPHVVSAIQKAATRGTSYAVTTEAEIEFAEMICDAIPSIERVRLVSSGTEACMTALRLARGFTGRNKILKFAGCYHGHSDGMLVSAGSGVAGIATASSAGVPSSLAEETLVADYNNLDQVREIVTAYGDDLAAIAVEPIAANMGLVEPVDGFLEGLRKVCDETGALLIFDEVITGFRIAYGGYQNVCGIKPDLTCLGKIIGGGMPIGAIGGRADIMERLAPLGDVYQAGTLSGNPISVAAGLANLKVLRDENPYDALSSAAEELVSRIQSACEQSNRDVQIPRVGSMFNLFFTDRPVRSFADVETCDASVFRQLFMLLLDRGVYLPPSPFEVSFLSMAHDEEVLGRAGEIFNESIGSLR